MDKPNKLNERLTLIANLSVVVGIVFLAYELRQNTEAIQAQTRDSITEKQMEYLGWRATSPELAAVLAKADSVGGDALSDAERQQWSGYYGGQLREWENSFYQFERGLFSGDEFEARREFWRTVLRREEEVRDFYSFNRPNFAPSFRAEIDRIVAEVGG